MKLLLVILPLLLSILAINYQQRLASGKAKGGAISNAKLFWLFFALYIYYVVNPIFSFTATNDRFVEHLKLVFYFMIARLLFQGIWMYALKKWTPKFGFSLNAIGFILVVYGLMSAFETENLLSDPGFILLVIHGLCFALDFHYALFFERIIGERTQGEKPIWYANATDPKFRSINKQTFYANIVLSLLFIYWIGAIYFFKVG